MGDSHYLKIFTSFQSKLALKLHLSLLEILFGKVLNYIVLISKAVN